MSEFQTKGFNQDNWMSPRAEQEIARTALHVLFETEMQEVDERLISREEAFTLLRDYVDNSNVI